MCSWLIKICDDILQLDELLVLGVCGFCIGNTLNVYTHENFEDAKAEIEKLNVV